MTTNITQAQAIELARQKILALDYRVCQTEPEVIRKDRHMRLDRKLSGWLVVFDLDVCKSLDPNNLMIEVYDDGRVHIPDHL